MANILITGGAGCIGRHVARALVAHGENVRRFDALVAQVHDERAKAIPAGAEQVATSMSIYGEGLYRDADGGIVDATRPGRRDPLDESGRPLTPVPTPEHKRPSLASVYALTKYAQERLTLNVCGAYGMEGVASRLFNVYGPGQALSNPYIGSGESRDIRHCFADISKARAELGYAPKTAFAAGVAELAEWLREQSAEQARRELEARGLVA